MDNSSLRHVCFWFTLISGVVWLGVSTAVSAATLGMLRPMSSTLDIYVEVFGISLGWLSLAGLLFGVLHSISLLILMALLHRDLDTCERWVSYERSRLVSGESGRLSEDAGAGAVGAPKPTDPGSRTQSG